VDLYLTITDELAKEAKKFLPMSASNVKRLYYGVEKPPAMDTTRREEVRRSLGVNAITDFTIGLIGRIEYGKGQHILIDAVSRLNKEGLPVHATIIGPVMDQNYYEQIQNTVHETGLQNLVTFYGSHYNPIEIMGAYDAVVLATKKETFGLVLVEAMRSGVAVIGTNAGGVPEIIDHDKTGLLVKPLDAADLADKLRQLCQKPGERQRLAENGKQKADSMFATEAHYVQLEQYFNSVSSGG
jgi:glycosyltransferase involved in cell wall biosynthesis